MTSSRRRASVFFVVHLVVLLLTTAFGARGVANRDGRAPAVLATKDAPRLVASTSSEVQLERAARPRSSGDPTPHDPPVDSARALATLSTAAIAPALFVLTGPSRVAHRHADESRLDPHRARGPPQST